MPYTMKVEGMEKISETLSSLAEKAPAVAALGLYEGAGIIADEMGKQAKEIRTEPFRGKVSKRKPSPQEKAIVLNAARGIAKFDKNGTEVETSVGFRNAGYATLAGKTVPVPKIVNAINSGTSFMTKQPFIRNAAKSGGKAAIDAMEKKINEEFEKITGGDEA